MQNDATEPTGALTIRTLAMPADTNPAGDIFGGWVMSQMDIAGAIAAVERVKGRVVTVAVEAMTFIAPVRWGMCSAFMPASSASATPPLPLVLRLGCVATGLMTAPR